MLLMGVVHWLMKADIDAAFRGVPLYPKHMWAGGVAFLLGGKPHVSFHHGMPFGATSSVIAWHRTGRLITTIATRSLKIPILRYVDDFLQLNGKKQRYACNYLRVFLGSRCA